MGKTTEGKKDAPFTQDIMIGDKTIQIPAYYQKVESAPDDPEGSVSYMVNTEHAICLLILSPEDYSGSLPRDVSELIGGIRQYLGEQQGLIKVEAGVDYSYSIVKTLMEPSGVQYGLTCQKYYADTIIQVQGFFEENGATGLRDNIAYEICRREKLVGSDQNPFEGWVSDPYDPSVTHGALMNLSEKEQFDTMFPDFPLSLCRSVASTLTEVEV